MSGEECDDDDDDHDLKWRRRGQGQKRRRACWWQGEEGDVLRMNDEVSGGRSVDGTNWSGSRMTRSVVERISKSSSPSTRPSLVSDGRMFVCARVVTAHFGLTWSMFLLESHQILIMTSWPSLSRVEIRIIRRPSWSIPMIILDALEDNDRSNEIKILISQDSSLLDWLGLPLMIMISCSVELVLVGFWTFHLRSVLLPSSYPAHHCFRLLEPREISIDPSYRSLDSVSWYPRSSWSRVELFPLTDQFEIHSFIHSSYPPLSSIIHPSPSLTLDYY